jgi:SnoaL-like domain
MQSSDELKAIVHQIYEQLRSGGLLDFARRLYSRQDCVSVIGSEPNDRYEDYESIVHFYEAASAARLEVKVDDLKAFFEGEFGWAVDRIIAKLPNDIEIPVRHTYVFHKESEQWKIVHTHISVGISDESLGVKG